MKVRAKETISIEKHHLLNGKEYTLPDEIVKALGNSVEVLKQPKTKDFKGRNKMMTKKQVRTK